MVYPRNFESKIGFDSVKELLKKKCLSPLGEELVDGIRFSTSHPEIKLSLELASEFVRVLEGEELFPDQHFFDMRPSLKRIGIVGLYLNEQELFDLRRSLDTIAHVVAFFAHSSGEKEENKALYPSLCELAGSVAVPSEIIARIDKVLDPLGKIKDNASPELARIRREIVKTTEGIYRELSNIIRAAQSQGLVDKNVNSTMRDGRLVIPVAHGLKRKIKGIIHDESATGKTIFIEPAEVVEANNYIRELEGDEKREIVRILTELSDVIRPFADELLQAYAFLGEIDFIRAKALLALQTDGRQPEVVDGALVDLKDAVHPLLALTLSRQGKKIVPLDLRLDERHRILIISGPNAGGKSVCLKTVGLLQYMLQCGLLIPLHESSRMGIFHSLFIDIGDEQSIENDLSTYSSHLLNMKMMMKHCDERSLILIDEFGGGTEPGIGGAIAEAVLQRFTQKRVYGVITTHYQNLKEFAKKHEGVINGAMLYDRHTMQALFQLQVGNPGSSFAIEIARKIGLPKEVIDEASRIVGEEYINADKYLQDIARDKGYWERKRQSITLREKQLEASQARYAEEIERLKSEKKAIILQAKEEAQQLIARSNALIENTIRAIKESQAEREQTKQARQQLADYREQLSAADLQADNLPLPAMGSGKKKKKKKAQAAGTAESVSASRPVIEAGCTVRIKGQSTTGRVLEADGKQAVVAFGNMKTTVRLDSLELAQVASQAQRGSQVVFIGSQTTDQLHEKKLRFKQDIDVRGMSGDEALQAVTYFIDDALLVGVKRVRILHGTGSGILRTLIREYLATQPGICRYHDEDVRLGGAGITVVDFD